jgi:hypothetical protein
MGQRGAGAARPREGGASRSAAGGVPIRVATRALAQSGRLGHPSDPSPARGPPDRFPSQPTVTRHAAGALRPATVRPAGTHSLPSQTFAGWPAGRPAGRKGRAGVHAHPGVRTGSGGKMAPACARAGDGRLGRATRTPSRHSDSMPGGPRRRRGPVLEADGGPTARAHDRAGLSLAAARGPEGGPGPMILRDHDVRVSGSCGPGLSAQNACASARGPEKRALAPFPRAPSCPR